MDFITYAVGFQQHFRRLFFQNNTSETTYHAQFLLKC